MRSGRRRSSLLRPAFRQLVLALALLGATCGFWGCGGARPLPEETAVEEPEALPRPPFTIYRDELDAALDRGLQPLIADVRLKAVHDGPRFVGWRVQFLHPGEDPFRHSAVRPGDVLMRVNGSPLERPDQMMEVWKSLEEADILTFSVLRAGKPVEVTYAIVARDEP